MYGKVLGIVMEFRKEFKQGCMLVIGGARSGKSRFALDFCQQTEKRLIFLATARAGDREMAERIRRHQEEREREWLTIEEPLDIVDRIRETDDEDTAILLDCLVLWINNLYMKYGHQRESIDQEINTLVNHLSGIRGLLVMVSNELGMSIVPDNPLARDFRDRVGTLNQRIAGLAQKVVMLMAGLPLVLKDN
jgi:adenosyl cobinamide kinase/adenosyl cobinamide phosphate guanylyltransferase